MKIGILGSGDVGQALARGFLARGDEVMLGTRDPKSEKAQKIAADLGELKVGSFERWQNLAQ